MNSLRDPSHYQTGISAVELSFLEFWLLCNDWKLDISLICWFENKSMIINSQILLPWISFLPLLKSGLTHPDSLCSFRKPCYFYLGSLGDTSLWSPELGCRTSLGPSCCEEALDRTSLQPTYSGPQPLNLWRYFQIVSSPQALRVTPSCFLSQGLQIAW